MAQTGYGQLNAVADDASRQLLQHLLELTASLQERVTTLEAQALLRNGPGIAVGARLTGLADPLAGGDAVNQRTLRAYVAGQIGAFTQPPP